MGIEKNIEGRLRDGVKMRGGMALKFTSPSFTGVPDRIVLMPNGRIWFVETKAPTGGVSPRQRLVHKMLRGLGFKVVVMCSDEQLKTFFTIITDQL